MSSNNTIVIKGDPIAGEALGGAAITPGQLIDFFAGSGHNVLVPHSSASSAAAPRFATEDFPRAGEISDAYASGSTVQYVHARRGDRIQAYLADGESVVKGSMLESDGLGSLKAGTTYPIAQAYEVLDNSAGGAAARLVVEVL